jgi:hypothetical protein
LTHGMHRYARKKSRFTSMGASKGVRSGVNTGVNGTTKASSGRQSNHGGVNLTV